MRKRVANGIRVKIRIRIFLLLTVLLPTMLTKVSAAEPSSEVRRAQLRYELPAPFQGDGESSFIDTGISLYDGTMEEWIVIACISSKLPDGENVFFSCFSEQEPYRGLLMRNPKQSEYEFIGGTQGRQWFYPGDAPYFTIAIQRSGNTYLLFYNGEVIQEWESERVAQFNGTLLIGCQETADGERFRFNKVLVDKLQVYEGSQSPSFTAAAMEQIQNPGRVGVQEEVPEKILLDRTQRTEVMTARGHLEQVLRKNGKIFLLLAAGFMIACGVTVFMNRSKKKNEDGEG